MVSIVGSTFIVKHVYNDNRTRFGRNAKLNRSELEVRLKVFFFGGGSTTVTACLILNQRVDSGYQLHHLTQHSCMDTNSQNAEKQFMHESFLRFKYTGVRNYSLVKFTLVIFSKPGIIFFLFCHQVFVMSFLVLSVLSCFFFTVCLSVCIKAVVYKPRLTLTAACSRSSPVHILFLVLY